MKCFNISIHSPLKNAILTHLSHFKDDCLKQNHKLRKKKHNNKQCKRKLQCRHKWTKCISIRWKELKRRLMTLYSTIIMNSFSQRQHRARDHLMMQVPLRIHRKKSKSQIPQWLLNFKRNFSPQQILLKILKFCLKLKKSFNFAMNKATPPNR